MRRSSVNLTKMQNIHFDQFDYEEHELPQLVVDFFAKWSLFEEFKVPVPVFKNFVEGMFPYAPFQLASRLRYPRSARGAF